MKHTWYWSPVSTQRLTEDMQKIFISPSRNIVVKKDKVWDDLNVCALNLLPKLTILPSLMATGLVKVEKLLRDLTSVL